MESLEVVEHVGPGLVAGAVAATENALPLEQAKEALAGRVVAAVADGAHALDQAVAGEKLLVHAAAELATAVRVQDDLAGALASVADLEQLLQLRTIYLGRLASIYTAAQAWPQLAEVQAEAMELSQHNSSAVIDLATTLAWRLQRIEEAETLMQRIAGCELALPAQAYADFVNGLIARSRSQNGRAESLLRRSVEQLADFSDNPLTRLVIDLFNAERLITLAALGKTAKAAELLRRVLPRLQAHGELETIRRCAAATLARPPG